MTLSILHLLMGLPIWKNRLTFSSVSFFPSWTKSKLDFSLNNVKHSQVKNRNKEGLYKAVGVGEAGEASASPLF